MGAKDDLGPETLAGVGAAPADGGGEVGMDGGGVPPALELLVGRGHGVESFVELGRREVDVEVGAVAPAGSGEERAGVDRQAVGDCGGDPQIGVPAERDVRFPGSQRGAGDVERRFGGDAVAHRAQGPHGGASTFLAVAPGIGEAEEPG